MTTFKEVCLSLLKGKTVARFNLELTVREGRGSGKLVISEAWIDDEEGDQDNDTTMVPYEISDWLEKVLHPHEYRNLKAYMSAKIATWPPEDDE